MLINKYLPIFNITQTPYPVFDKYITDLLWPQTKYYGSSTVCQPSGPIAINTDIVWKMSESNMSLVVVPFSNWQGIPISIASVQSIGLDSSLISSVGNKIIISSGYEYLDGFRNLNVNNQTTGIYFRQIIYSDNKSDPLNNCWRIY